MDKLTDSELLSRLIYKAFVSPEPSYTSEDAIITFPQALDLHARIAAGEAKAPAQKKPAPKQKTPEEPPDKPEHEAPPALTPDAIRGYCAEEKKEIFAELLAFCATHGLGARKKIADASGGKLTLSDVMDLTDCKNRPIQYWRAARAAMDKIAEEETIQGGNYDT